MKPFERKQAGLIRTEAQHKKMMQAAIEKKAKAERRRRNKESGVGLPPKSKLRQGKVWILENIHTGGVVETDRLVQFCEQHQISTSAGYPGGAGLLRAAFNGHRGENLQLSKGWRIMAKV